MDLTAIEGIDAGTALVILAEVGPDVSRFPTEKHFASWLRLCPPQDRSNKTDRRRRGPKGASRAARRCGWRRRRWAGRRRPWGCSTAGSRAVSAAWGRSRRRRSKLGCLIYRMLKYGQEYVVQSMEEYEAKMKANLLKSLERKAAALGFGLSPLPSE